MMLSADGARLWAAHKLAGVVSIISTASRRVVAVLDTGPETNHPNFASISAANGTTATTYGFVTVAARDATRVYAQPDAEAAPRWVRDVQSSGVEPHGLWPSADNARMYVVNEHSDTVDEIDLTRGEDGFRVVRTVGVGQEGQALVYVSNAVPEGGGAQNLGTQGLVSGGSAVLNRVVEVVDGGGGDNSSSSPSALVTVRPAVGLDMFQDIGRNLRLNATYEVSAACGRCGGVRIPLLDFVASMPIPGQAGCATAPQVLGFFKFDGVYDVDSLQVREK